MRSVIRSIASALLMVACLSCASRGAESPQPSESPQPTPEIYVAVDASPDGFRDAALDISKKRLAGHDVIYEPTQGHAPALTLTLHLTYRNLTPSEFETVWGITTYLLATLYPSTCAHRTYTLSADLTDVAGHSRNYEETDTTVAWLWLFNGPRCGETPSKGEIESMTHRLLDAVYDRMQRHGTFSIAPLADTRQAPLVRISANRADAIAEQVLRVDRPFERWTMTDDPATLPDYQLDLFFDVGPGAFSIPKAYFAIMTFGLFGVCNSTPITLIATFTSLDAERSKSYVRSKSVRGHMGANGSDCEIQDERTRPEAFADLLRQVFKEAQHDKLVPKSVVRKPVQLAPFVRVLSGGAEGVVRRETVHSTPFPRYVFGTASEFPVDYSLQLDIQFSGGGLKKTGIPGQIGEGLSAAWLGRFTGCEPTTMALTAALTDKQGAEIARYQIVHTVRSTGRFDARVQCRDDEYTNPNAVADLVHSLYKEMKDDGTLAMLKGSTG